MTYLRDRLPSTIIFAASLLLSAYGGIVLLLGHGGIAVAAGIAWACAQTLLIVLCILHFLSASRQDAAERQVQQLAQMQRSILDSAGPMILATDLEGNLLIFNPAAERMLGYRVNEVLGRMRAEDLFPEGELERVGRLLVSRLERTSPVDLAGVSSGLRHYAQYVTSFPVSRVRGFEIQFRRKDGSSFPAMVYLSAVRNAEGALTGLLAIATDLTATKRAEHALRESEERYRDLFENSQEMIATLSPRGKYLYVNPAWQGCFGKSAAAFETLLNFEAAFPQEMQSEAAALFERALHGERIDGANLRVLDSNGIYRELEASLSCRQDRGEPVSVRCIFRDVTAQYQRERRLAMQLAVSQVVGESTTSDEALPAMLESLGTNLGFDMAGLWFVASDQHTRYLAGWYAPDCACAEFHRDSIGRVIEKGKDLPGAIWAAESPCWIEDLQENPDFQRTAAATVDGLVTGWGVPVRVGNQVIAVVEFFSREKQKEDREMMATVETVCASIGQFMARSAQESRLEELNRQKESILNSVADGIFGTDSNGRIVFVNPAAASMLGAQPFDLIGRSVHSVVHEERRDHEICTDQCRTRRALLVREANSGQDVFYRKNGASFPVEFSLTPMVEHSVAVGSVLSFRDISQRYALDRMKDEFVSTVSHELRTPLTSIRGALGLLSAGLLGEVGDKASNLLRIAVSNSDRLVRLINDILDLERMQSGRAPLAYRLCCLEELARQAIDAMTPMAEAAKVQLLLDSEPMQVEADADRLLQVMTNLLSNAIKFSPPHSQVTVKLERLLDGVTLNVIDHGRGIPKDKLESIFDRFQQVDASDSRQKGGTGLGLAICRTIVQQHAGRIWAERNPDRGSTFRMFLPAVTREADPPAHDGHRRLETVAESTILICDENMETRSLLAECLKDKGYYVLEAFGGDEAVAIARQTRIDAILLDLSLPGLHGWETLRLLRDDRRTASIPVVVLSAFGVLNEPEIEKAADAWLHKPLEEETLLLELARVLHPGSDPARLLLVEDDADLAKVILATFERAGIEVCHASTRRKAIELCLTSRPDLIILDLALPDGDGFGVVDWLRQQNDLSSLPLVVYSAQDLNDGERKKLQLGPTEFLTKAKVQLSDVETLVLTMLRQYRLIVEDKLDWNGAASTNL
ncbi:MAG TPA: PAS domain S-box protein [Acidobacteriaceae bacterium]|nr:PAS domain S-box protein [Acidobacteriaceae bacterium]